MGRSWKTHVGQEARIFTHGIPPTITARTSRALSGGFARRSAACLASSLPARGPASVSKS